MIRVIGLVLTICAVLVSACGGSEADSFVPAGMVQGQPTFLYLFTDN